MHNKLSGQRSRPACLPGMDFYNSMRDLGEKYGKLYPGLFAVALAQNLIGSHKGMMVKFKNFDPAETKGKGH